MANVLGLANLTANYTEGPSSYNKNIWGHWLFIVVIILMSFLFLSLTGCIIFIIIIISSPTRCPMWHISFLQWFPGWPVVSGLHLSCWKWAAESLNGSVQNRDFSGPIICHFRLTPKRYFLRGKRLVLFVNVFCNYIFRSGNCWYASMQVNGTFMETRCI